jgi:bilirubin oxidase
MQGRKDVVLVPGGMGTVRFITKFQDYWSLEYPYMYHCHMLTHEDDGMMGQFRVIPENVGQSEHEDALDRIQAFPNPAKDNIELRLDGTLGAGTITLTDASGRAALTQRVTGERIQLSTGALAPGTYVATFRGERGVAHVRFVRE